MQRFLTTLGCLLLILVALGNPSFANEPPLRVLFLGDQGHHQPANRAAQLMPALAGRGIDVTYTEDVGVLDADFLRRFDALILYANIEHIAPEHVAGLIDYVESGGGFVAIHCASYCGLNSPEFTALVGARFLRHGTGTFKTKVVAPQHPIMQGVHPFVTWDETYVHTMHNMKNRTVLQVRPAKDHAEPWTWVRTQGEGRVFYTAYGHDARTWMKPGFQALIERAIRWVAKRKVYDSLSGAKAGLPPFEYKKASLPNYVPDAKWGTQGDPITRMQLPLEPAASQKHLVVPPGFQAKLFAAEPEITKPITMAWDAQGRLWIAETVDYPNNKQPPGAGHDRIKICEDTNGDGKADSLTVFAEGLSLPYSIAFAYGGIVVLQPPHTLFLKDTDGDDRADVRKVLFTGWSTEDTHAGPSNLTYGLDGWYYGIVGYAGFQGKIASEERRFRQGFYRFKLSPPAEGKQAPTVKKFEFLRSTSNNSWGVGISEEGLLFGSTANGCASVFAAIPNRYYESVLGWAPRVLQAITPSNRFFPITENVRQVDWHGGFTAAAGHSLYTARAYPQQYWNKTAFVCGPTGHLVATFVLAPQGSGFQSFNSWNLLASDDAWTAPIDAVVGPDGNVWVIDWYNYVVQHNPTPRGFDTGKGNAYVTELRDKSHGRIYRIDYQSKKSAEPPQLDPDDPESLLAALDHPNLGWRLHAQRLLIERGGRDVVENLIPLLSREKLDATGLDRAAVHALCVLQGLGVLADRPELACDALDHPSAAVRRIAAHLLPSGPKSTTALVESGVLDDSDAQVRLAAWLALSEQPASAKATDAVATALNNKELLADRWLSHAVTAAAAAQAGQLLRTLEGEQLADGAPEILRRVAEHYTRLGETKDLAAVLEALADRPRVAEPVLAGFAEGTDGKIETALGDDVAAALAKLYPQLSPAGRGRLVRLAQGWKIEGFQHFAEQLAETMLDQVENEDAEIKTRLQAARRLVSLRPESSEVIEQMLKTVSPQAPPALAAGLIEVIGQSRASEAGELLVDRLGSATPTVRREMLQALLSRAPWTTALLEGIESGAVRLSALSLQNRRALRNHPNNKIAERATSVLKKGGDVPDADRQKVIERLLTLVSQGGSAKRGRAVFKKNCATCHQHGKLGHEIGPDLTGMSSHPRDELLVHILDPNRSVEGNFRQYTAVTSEGIVLSGMLSAETRTTLVMIDTEGKKHTLVRNEIEELIPSSKSLMPVGFEKQVSTEQFRDLLAFLTNKGHFVPLELREAATITSVRGMFFDKSSQVERIVLPDWSPRRIAGVPFRFVDPKEGRVANMILLYGPQGTYPPRMPHSVKLPVHTAAKAIHFLGGVAGWGFPLGEVGSSSLIVRLHYADGVTEDHVWRNGKEVADYIRVVDIPKSKLAFKTNGHQMRYLSVIPERDVPIAELELLEGSDATAPLVMAITVETPE